MKSNKSCDIHKHCSIHKKMAVETLKIKILVAYEKSTQAGKILVHRDNLARGNPLPYYRKSMILVPKRRK